MFQQNADYLTLKLTGWNGARWQNLLRSHTPSRHWCASQVRRLCLLLEQCLPCGQVVLTSRWALNQHRRLLFILFFLFLPAPINIPEGTHTFTLGFCHPSIPCLHLARPSDNSISDSFFFFLSCSSPHCNSAFVTFSFYCYLKSWLT